MLGLRRPTSGTVELFGGDPRDAVNRRRIGNTPQETGLPPLLRVREVVDFVAGHYERAVPTGELLERFGLEDLARRQTGGLSGGQKRRLAVALAFVGHPRLVFLDEPTTGLDVDARHALWQAIREFHADGGTVVLTSHYLEEVQALAERVVVIDRGRVLADDTLDAVRAVVDVRRVSLRTDDPGALAALPGRHVGDRGQGRPHRAADHRLRRRGARDRLPRGAVRRPGGLTHLAGGGVPLAHPRRAPHRLDRHRRPGGGAPMSMLALHTRYQLLEQVRIPMAMVGNIAFPALSYLFFIVPQSALRDEPSAATAAAGQLALVSVLSVCLFSFGLGTAEERSTPWDPYLRTLSAGVLPRLGRQGDHRAALRGRRRGRRRGDRAAAHQRDRHTRPGGHRAARDDGGGHARSC